MDTLSAHFFTWTGNDGCCEASDLPVHQLPERFNVAGRTRTVEFYKTGELRDRENELVGWRYRSTCQQFKIEVFND